MKTFLLILFATLSFVCFSQTQRSFFPVKDSSLQVEKLLTIPKFYDTTAANTSNSHLDSSGALLYTRSDGKVWVRSVSPKRWLELATSSLGYIKAQGTVTYVSIAAGGNNQNDVTIMGASVGDLVLVDQDQAQTSIIYSGWVVGTNQVRIRAYNTTAAPITPASHTFNIIVLKY